MKPLLLLFALSIGLFAQTANPQLSAQEKTSFDALLQEQVLIAKDEENIRLRKENLTLKAQAFFKSVEDAHPGYALDGTGKLVKKETPKAEPKKEEKK